MGNNNHISKEPFDNFQSLDSKVLCLEPTTGENISDSSPHNALSPDSHGSENHETTMANHNSMDDHNSMEDHNSMGDHSSM